MLGQEKTHFATWYNRIYSSGSAVAYVLLQRKIYRILPQMKVLWDAAMFKLLVSTIEPCSYNRRRIWASVSRNGISITDILFITTMLPPCGFAGDVSGGFNLILG